MDNRSHCNRRYCDYFCNSSGDGCCGNLVFTLASHLLRPKGQLREAALKIASPLLPEYPREIAFAASAGALKEGKEY